jgi:hypothetical protein
MKCDTSVESNDSDDMFDNMSDSTRSPETCSRRTSIDSTTPTHDLLIVPVGPEFSAASALLALIQSANKSNEIPL